MANQEQVDLLRQGVPELWQRWRLHHPDRQPELQAADLAQANLAGVDLTGADLTLADLTEADLNHANLSQAMLADAMTDLAICKSQSSPQDPRSSPSRQREEARLSSQAE